VFKKSTKSPRLSVLFFWPSSFLSFGGYVGLEDSQRKGKRARTGRGREPQARVFLSFPARSYLSSNTNPLSLVLYERVIIRRQRAGLAEILGLSFTLSSTQDQPQGKVKERLVVEDKGKKDKPFPPGKTRSVVRLLSSFVNGFLRPKGKTKPLTTSRDDDRVFFFPPTVSRFFWHISLLLLTTSPLSLIDVVVEEDKMNVSVR